jgi:glycerol uptake facilitator-like aquaporin
MKEILAEGLGTGLLLYIIVGSGIAAETFGADQGGQLFAHAIVVGVGLGVLIVFLQPVSGSHFNPAVTMAFWRTGAIEGKTALGYLAAQLIGAVLGVVAANISFGVSAAAISPTLRGGSRLLLSEGIATLVLVLLILGLVRSGKESAVPAAAGAWVAAAVFATASTGFANPAVTVARIFTDSFTGIAPASAAGFVAVQLLAGLLAVPLALSLYSKTGAVRASI